MLAQRFYCVPVLIARDTALLIRPIMKDEHSREGDDDWDETTATGMAITDGARTRFTLGMKIRSRDEMTQNLI